MPSNRRLLSQEETALSGHNIDSKLNAILQQQIAQLQLEVINAKEGNITTPIYSATPWWVDSYWLVIGVALISAAAAVGIGYLIISSDKSIFLIGDEKRRQVQASNRRERVVWGVVVAFVVSVVASLVAPHL